MTALERRAVGSLALLYSFRMLGLFMVLPLLALYAADMPGATPALIGLALGIYGLTQALLQIPFGWLSDQIGRKPVIVGGFGLIVIGSVVAASADTIQGVIFGRSLQGAGAIASALMALVADVTGEEQRTKAMAIVGMSIGLSFAVALVLGPVVAAGGGLSAVFWFTALLAVAGVAILLLLVPTPEKTGVQHAEVGTRAGLVGRSLRDPALQRLNLGVFTLHFTLMACFLTVPTFLEQTAGIDRDDHWLIYLPALALSIAGMVPMMILAERRGHHHPVFLAAILLLLVSVALLGTTVNPLIFYVALWVFFVGFNYLEATLPSLVSKAVFPGGKGTALGVYSTCQFLGIFAGGSVGGWLLQLAGIGAVIGACLALATLWLLLVLPSRAMPLPARQ